MIRRAVAVAFVLVCLPVAGSAHPFAVSHFEVRTDGDALRISFQLDATSVEDLIERATGAAGTVSAHRDTVLRYVDERFAVAADDRRCAREPGTRVSAPDENRRVHLSGTWRCPAEPTVLGIESLLFLDEDTPHRVLATLRHGRALERFLFGRSELTARVELAALRQAGAVADDRQFRTATPPPGAFSRAGPSSTDAERDAGFVSFIGVGLHHIAGGLDHILFVICLVLGARRFRELVAVITAFTLAHSITLVLGGLGLVTISPALVEPLIAASIAYVALDNALREQRHDRFWIVFGFGLMHGFGFSEVLAGLGLSAADTVPLLLGLNVGVELGQLAIVAPLYPLVRLLQRHPRAYRRTRIIAGAAIAALACIWVVQRLSSAV